MGRMELPQAACFDFPEGLSNQNVQECSSGCLVVIALLGFPKADVESSDSPTIFPSSSTSRVVDDVSYSSNVVLFSPSAIVVASL